MLQEVKTFFYQKRSERPGSAPFPHTPSVTHSSLSHRTAAHPGIPSTHNVLGEPLPVACLRSPWVGLLSFCGRGVMIKSLPLGDEALPPGGLRDRASDGHDGPCGLHC